MHSTMQIAEHIGAVCPPETRSHETVHRFRVSPVDVGIAGFVDGGTLLEWMDKAAHATAAQWCAGDCVAASVGNFHLDRPIGVGERVELHASLVYTGHSSMHILVTICSGDSTGAKPVQTAQCSTVFVAVDASGTPVDVPRWTPRAMLELQRHRQARARVRIRGHIEDAMETEGTDEGTAPQIALRVCAATTDVNPDGKVRAGRVMRWIDEAAYVCGADWAGAEVITSYLAGIRFCRTVFVGDVIDVTARIIHTGPRSTHISVRVTTTNAVCGQPLLVALGVVVVVSLDDHGEARPIPQWEPGCDRDARVDQHARRLTELRQHIEPFTTAATFAIDAEAGTPAPQQGRPRVRNLGGAMTENVDVDAGSTAIV